MIRRNPTLIPLTDADVQDVRDMVAKQKTDLHNHQQLMVKMRRLAESPLMSKEDKEMFEQMKEALVRTDKAKDKAKRLGLDPGQFAFAVRISHIDKLTRRIAIPNRIFEVLITHKDMPSAIATSIYIHCKEQEKSKPYGRQNATEGGISGLASTT
ncbi:hypothetical protein CVT25_014140 [Psilocybe cyanescens]|uniref:Uncharacterized protein n=1 Tax=Psilocybe cyanescens TaxID=93625 RepID=A0A409XG20_PSICY|nr:hypothetical protein CVT25_014140 [Psilocybe cyanescens]